MTQPSFAGTFPVSWQIWLGGSMLSLSLAIFVGGVLAGLMPGTEGRAVAVAIYLGSWGVGVSIAAAWQRRRNRTLAVCFKRVFYWVGFWHAGVVLMCLGGALLGALLFPAIGLLARLDYAVTTMVLNGIRDGGFYALIWAPGTVLVAAFMHGKRRSNRPSS